jgi:hypothetical protein
VSSSTVWGFLSLMVSVIVFVSWSSFESLPNGVWPLEEENVLSFIRMFRKRCAPMKWDCRRILRKRKVPYLALWWSKSGLIFGCSVASFGVFF